MNSIAPLHNWQRHHPLAHAIADELLASPAILHLRTRLLQRDIQAKHKVAPCTARNAVAIARKAVAR